MRSHQIGASVLLFRAMLIKLIINRVDDGASAITWCTKLLVALQGSHQGSSHGVERPQQRSNNSVRSASASNSANLANRTKART